MLQVIVAVFAVGMLLGVTGIFAVTLAAFCDDSPLNKPPAPGSPGWIKPENVPFGRRPTETEQR